MILVSFTSSPGTVRPQIRFIKMLHNTLYLLFQMESVCFVPRLNMLKTNPRKILGNIVTVRVISPKRYFVRTVNACTKLAPVIEVGSLYVRAQFSANDQPPNVAKATDELRGRALYYTWNAASTKICPEDAEFSPPPRQDDRNSSISPYIIPPFRSPSIVVSCISGQAIMAKEQYANTKVIRKQRTSAKLEVSSCEKGILFRRQFACCTRSNFTVTATTNHHDMQPCVTWIPFAAPYSVVGAVRAYSIHANSCTTVRLQCDTAAYEHVVPCYAVHK